MFKDTVKEIVNKIVSFSEQQFQVFIFEIAQLEHLDALAIEIGTWSLLGCNTGIG